jgi:hypothetical protein
MSGSVYAPPFRLVVVHPDGFTDYELLKAKLDALLVHKGPVHLLHPGCALAGRYLISASAPPAALPSAGPRQCGLPPCL